MWPWQNIARVDFKLRLALAIAVEVVYMALSRYIFQTHQQDFAIAELWRTPLRLVAAFALWLLMRDLIFSGRPDLTGLRSPRLWIALVLITVATLVMAESQSNAAVLILSLTTIPVGLQEEFFFRGIVQNLVVQRLGVAWGVVFATIVFTLFHVGMAFHDFFSYFQIAVAGAALGIVYVKTKSIALVVVLHAFDDVFSAASSLLDQTWPLISLMSMAVGLTLLVRWARPAAPNHMTAFS